MEKPYIRVSYHSLEKRLHVSTLSDRFMFSGSPEYGGMIVLLSALGPHSAVRGLLAAVASGRDVQVDAYPRAWFRGAEGGRSLTAALSKEVTHGIYVGPSLLLGSGQTRSITVLDDDPRKVFQRLAYTFAIPALPEWAEWLLGALKRAKKLTPLAGHRARGCTLDATEEDLDKLLASGVKEGAIRF
jgi:hypothetical protein